MTKNPCQITINTVVDGEETRSNKQGELSVFENGAEIVYHEENALVSIRFEGKGATITRKGDYSLYLPLEQGVQTEGALGLGSSQGAVAIDTHKVEFSAKESNLLAVLHYDLLLGKERQQMRLRLYAKGE